MLVVAIGLGAYTVTLRQRVTGLEVALRGAVARLDRSERQLASATRDAERAQVRLAVLTAPDMKQVELAGQAPAPRAAGPRIPERLEWPRVRRQPTAATAGWPDLPAVVPDQAGPGQRRPVEPG